MDIEPTSSPTTGQLVHPDTNRLKINTGTRDMAYSPRRRGRPRRSASVDKPASSASVPQVISRPDNSISGAGAGYTSEATHDQSLAAAMTKPSSNSGDVEMSYRRRG